MSSRDGEVYLVGRWGYDEGDPWEVIGIYTDRDIAEMQCHDSRSFVWPVPLNDTAPSGTEDMPGAYYPRKVDP